jgi:hypothetical protein
MIRPAGGQPPASLSAARELTTLRAYFVVSVIYFFWYHYPPDRMIHLNVSSPFNAPQTSSALMTAPEHLTSRE